MLIFWNGRHVQEPELAGHRRRAFLIAEEDDFYIWIDSLPALDRVPLNYIDMSKKGLRGGKDGQHFTSCPLCDAERGAFGSYDFPKDIFQVKSQFPIGEVLAEFSEIANVADVVALSWVVAIHPGDLFPCDFLDFVEGLQEGNAVRPASANVVDLAGAGIAEKFFGCSHDVKAVDVVAHLFCLVAQNSVGLARHGHLYEMGQKAVQLHPGMVGPGETSSPEEAHLEAEVAAVLLRENVASHFGGAENGMGRAVDSALLVDSLPIGGVSVLVNLSQLLQGYFLCA